MPAFSQKLPDAENRRRMDELAAALAGRFEQNACLAGEEGGAPQLILLAGATPA